MPSVTNTTPRTSGLESYLKRRNLTVAKVARDSGLEHSHVWRITKGEREPGVITFRKLARTLALPMETLYAMLYGHRN